MKKIQKGKERPALQKFGLAQKRRFFKAKKMLVKNGNRLMLRTILLNL